MSFCLFSSFWLSEAKIVWTVFLARFVQSATSQSRVHGCFGEKRKAVSKKTKALLGGRKLNIPNVNFYSY
jgi:hypothetical protein